MAQTVSIIIASEDRARLAAVIEDRNSPQKHVQRARIVLLSADRLPVLEIARQIGGSRPAVWRWQLRYAEQGVDGLLGDKTRKPGKAPVQLETVARVLALPCSEPPRNATHWTGRAVAKAIGVSLRTVQRIWDGHRLQGRELAVIARPRRRHLREGRICHDPEAVLETQVTASQINDTLAEVVHPLLAPLYERLDFFSFQCTWWRRNWRDCVLADSSVSGRPPRLCRGGISRLTSPAVTSTEFQS